MKASGSSKTSKTSNTASHPRRSESSSATPLWDPQITHKQNLFATTWNVEQNLGFTDTLLFYFIAVVNSYWNTTTSIVFLRIFQFSRAGWPVLSKMSNGRVGRRLCWWLGHWRKTDDRIKSGDWSSINCGPHFWTLGTHAHAHVRVCAWVIL
jgi:hypothetical protein